MRTGKNVEAYRARLRKIALAVLAVCAMSFLFPDGVMARPYLYRYFQLHGQTGVASWYGPHEAGRKTASGSIFDPSKLSAAHRLLPLGSCVRVTRLLNNRVVIVPITDRGPYARGRIIDLSQAAAEALDMTKAGLAQVRLEPARDCRDVHSL